MAELRVAIPKGRLYPKVVELLADSGISLNAGDRNYRFKNGFITGKVLKPQNIPKLVEIGAYDLGFTGLDWVKETKASVTELLDLSFDPVKIVIAGTNKTNSVPRVASEYENLTREYFNAQNRNFTFVRSYGATEALPPEDCDLIVDNFYTGKTLRQNGLKVLGTLLNSSTRLIANREALKDLRTKNAVGNLLVLLKSVLEARERSFLEMNIPKDRLGVIVPALPCMRSPTISTLYNGDYAVKIAVKKQEISALIPKLKQLGALDVVEFKINKVVV